MALKIVELISNFGGIIFALFLFMTGFAVIPPKQLMQFTSFFLMLVGVLLLFNILF